MEGLIMLLIILLIILFWPCKDKSGSKSGVHVVTSDSPPDPISCDSWGTAVPTKNKK